MACADTSMQLISGDGVFNASRLDAFVKTVKMAERGTSYAVISIMGPQSSGKSTLLNHLFGTKFREMNAEEGRYQTTEGVWMEKCGVDIEPFTIIMDMEGNDAREQQDDTTFGKQHALFALAVSDILLINMWCHDIDRERAANKALLKTVFQAMIRLNINRKKPLIFVMRDKTKKPAEKLKSDLMMNIQKIWDIVNKPEDIKGTHFSDVVHVEVVFLSHYEYQLSTFKEEVANLRQRCHSIIPGLAGDSRKVVSASEFALYMKEIWKDIKENKNLDLQTLGPANDSIVKRIQSETLYNFKEAFAAALRQGKESFADASHKYSQQFLLEFDETVGQDGAIKHVVDWNPSEVRVNIARDMDAHIASELAESSKVVRPSYDSIVGHIQSKTLSEFKEAFAADLVHRKEGFADAARRCTQHFLSEFDKRVKQDASIRHVEWNSSEFRDKLARDIDDHVVLVRATKLDEYFTQFKVLLYFNLKQALEKPVEKHLDEANDDTWPSIRELFRRETASYIHEFSSALNSEFHLDRATTDQTMQELLDYAREVVKAQAASAANNVLAHMKNKVSIFSHYEKHMAKEWKNLKEVESRSRTVVAACVKMLSVRAIVRLADQVDDIESILLGAFDGDANIALPNSNVWHEAYPDNTLISPVQCKDLLCELKEETKRLTLRPAYDSIVKRIQSETLYNFKEAFAAALRQGKESFADASLKYSQQFLLEFDERVGQDDAIKHVDWNPCEVRVNLARDMDAHIARELAESYKRELSHDLASPVARHLDKADHEMARGDTSMQLISGDGVFNASRLDAFVKTMKIAERETSYAVVSIMGPQSSGKSTLLNHLFGTKFREMDPEDGRSQTTKGIWLAQCVDIKPFTIVMDIEGNDGRERGEDDTAFEKQSALFALAISDIVLINMWCNDIGREHAANKPLLRTVFQAMIQSNMLRKATLLFVIRDKTKTPADKLESILKTDIQKIWDNVIKPQHQKGTRFRDVFHIWDNVTKPQYLKGTRFSDVFHVDVVFLSNYEHHSSAFKEEVMSLRQKICHSMTPRRLAGDGGKVVPASKLALNMKEIWKVIKENKDLDLPGNKVMEANARCEAIANEKLAIITAREDWGQLIDAKHETVMKFENELSKILDECLSRYDTETINFEEAVRTSRRGELLKDLLLRVDDAYYAIVGEIRSKTLFDFKVAFAKAVLKGKQRFSNAAFECTKAYLSEFDEKVKQGGAAIKYVNWDPSKIRDNLKDDMDAHAASVRDSYKKNKEKILKSLRTAVQSFVVVFKILSYIFGVPLDGVLDGTIDAIQALGGMLPDEE